MYLKSITLKGFKSFPERTRLEFGPGVSVIVGPNGSGKSNVTDAVLWAMGEQSPVAVRGASMQDVIFAGARGRQAAKGAEVELVLDDSEGSLSLGAPEVSILRRLDRNGEGEYRLAGARCRLVDVIELLSDTGMGKEMHSVISQGRVDSIVTSKPRERRLLIEEAAGLGKHRKRRRRAQLKLARTQENLDRALDVEREARSRLRPLGRQAEAAELHARLERQTLEARWELARDELRLRRAAQAQAQDEAARTRTRQGQLAKELDAVASRRGAAEEALAGRTAMRERLSERCFAARAAGERVADRAQAARAAAVAVNARLAHGTQQLGSLDLESGAGAEPPDSGASARIAALQDSLATLDRDYEAEVERQVAELVLQRAAAEGEVRRQEAAGHDLGGARARAQEGAEAARAAVREAERAVELARRDGARAGGELAAVNQFLRAQASSPRAGLALADELEVDPGYELALAAALDGRLRAAVVADRAAGAVLLDRAGAEGGRALIACAGDAEYGFEHGTEQPVAGAERLVDHVRGPHDAVALARALLGNTWVLDDLRAVPECFGGVAVTLGGRVLSPSWRELRQAPAVGEERVLAERNRRERLVAASEDAARAELSAAGELQRALASAAEADTQRERTVAEHRQALGDQGEAAEEVRRIGALIERRRAAPDEGPGAGRRAQLGAELSAERAALAHAQREHAQRRGRIERLRAAIARDEALGPVLGALIEALGAAGSAITQQRAAFDQALAADRQAGEHMAAELRACAQQETTLHARLQQENETLTGAEVQAQRARDRAAETGSELRELASRLELGAQAADSELSAQEREALSGRIDRLARRREQLGPVNPLAKVQYAEALEHVEELERQRCDLEHALRELEKLIADTDRQIRETFEETFDAAARGFEELAGVLFPGGVGRLVLVSERASFSQRLAGEAAEGSQGEAEPSDGEAARSEEVGDGDDLLGVEIEIAPAGKEQKRLSLLSGGEKSMTALAFLFAVFLARPCPFYILDEVEAALDDLNIERFLALLSRYAGQAQFIVVTHQKRTMEAAQSLYGVSMGADGVSKVISRRLPRPIAA
ncbi:MAG: AAA family ATPase [Actinomycetota bacterium]|nr:AAA family ATPase [Actinomycetota bacterium]